MPHRLCSCWCPSNQTTAALYYCDHRQYDDPEAALAAAITAIGTAQFVPAATDYLRSLAPFVGVFLTKLKGRQVPVHVYDNVRAERRTEVIDRYLDGAYLLDPFYEAYLSDPSSRLIVLNEVAPDRFLMSTYFRRYYQAIRLQDELAIFVGLADGSTLFYSIGRRANERRFGRREVAALRQALPVFFALNRRHFNSSSYRFDTPAEAAPSPSIEDAMIRFGAGQLTAREQEIAGLILKGHSSKGIAQLTDISPGTVKIHRKNIYRKLQISSQSELFSRFLNSLQA